jgi:hypothetical protein
VRLATKGTLIVGTNNDAAQGVFSVPHPAIVAAAAAAGCIFDLLIAHVRVGP